ncbi:MAG TPA: hypothetical protein VM842_00830, partial [Nitrospira sp.]|nr:hypothetical protein [Nitrospira sp.]
PEFRGRTRTVTEGESSTAGPLATDQKSVGNSRPPASNVIQTILRSVAEKVHPIQGLTGHQTAVLIVAGVCLVALLCVLFLTANPAIRLLAKCLLLLVSLTAMYHFAVGGPASGGPLAGPSPQASGQAADNIMGQVKTMTQQNYRLQDERTTHQLDQAESSTP